jgi:dinuclear metal center YbgI/SA1388 family protein
MQATVADVIRIMEQMAPAVLAESWDNVGLQAGAKTWPVQRVVVALDPSLEVVAAACGDDADLLICHHPLIFKPISTIDFNTPLGKILGLAIEHQMAIFSAHTNLDSALGGLNDMLAKRLGLHQCRVLADPVHDQAYKLVFFAPVTHQAQMLEILQETSAGTIGNYRACSFYSTGTGTFVPGADARPFSGRPDSRAEVAEVRIETVVAAPDIDSVVAHLKKNHPYETMAVDVYPLRPEATDQGLGRVGDLLAPVTLADLAELVKQALGLDTLKVAGRPDLWVGRLALCSGSGSSLMNAFFASGAQAYISGDLGYHNARDAQARDVGLIDAGHFGTEHIVVEDLTRRLKSALAASGWQVVVTPSPVETDPFRVG